MKIENFTLKAIKMKVRLAIIKVLDLIVNYIDKQNIKLLY
jgi:hypothetical protein